MSRKTANFFKLLAGNFRSAWGVGMDKGSVRQFKSYWKEAKRKSKGKKHAKARAVGTMVRARGINGPELNILFLGLPIIIHSFVSMGVNAPKVKRAKKIKRKLAGREYLQEVQPAGGRDGAIEFEIEQPRIRTGGGRPTPPLPSSPYSDQFVPMQAALMDMGMSAQAASGIAAGEFEGEDLADHLSEEDLEIFAAYLSERASVSDEGI